VHYLFHTIKIVAINRLFELADLFERLNMSLELWPTGKPIRPSYLKLRIAERLRAASLNR